MTIHVALAITVAVRRRLSQNRVPWAFRYMSVRFLLFRKQLMGSRRGQTQHLLHDIIYDQLTGDDHTNMQYACGQSSEEFPTPPTLVNITDGNAKGFG